MNTNEVFYNFTGTKVTKLKVKIEEPGNYGLRYIDGYISEDKPTVIDWGNGTKTTLTTPITSSSQASNSTDFYTNYSEPGEYVISIDGWYYWFKCYNYGTYKPDIKQINKVLTEIIQVSSLITNFNNTFYGCSSLTEIPSGLFDNYTSIKVFSSTFSGCTSLTSIPSGLFDNNTSVTTFNRTFEQCISLTSIPSGLFDKNTAVTVFSNTFIGCENLTGETPYTLSSDGKKIKLWDRDGTNGFVKPNGANVFTRCTKLTDYGDIPSDWK